MKFTEDEIATRIELVKPIVEGAFSLTGRTLSPDDLQRHARHWEASFDGVATEQLRDLYREGLKHKCRTSEQFVNVWEMKMEAEYQAAEYRRRQQEPERKGSPIPPHILKKWQEKGALGTPCKSA
jgi:hypothetical protein